MSAGPHIFGVRHLSPGAGYHLRAFLDEVQPTAVLIEGLSDADDQIVHLTAADTRPPVAILAYTQAPPVRTLVYPLSDYCAEYQALLWAREHGAHAAFIDLPSEVFLALERPQRLAAGDGIEPEAAGDNHQGETESTEEKVGVKEPGRLTRGSLYQRLTEQAGETDYETYWERRFEQNLSPDSYRRAAFEFGRGIRELAEDRPRELAENLVREASMRRRIAETLAAGHRPERVVAVVGAFHAPVLVGEGPEFALMTDAELAALPRVASRLTLMPYSYFKLSSQSGYGAGNHAPAYFGLLHELMRDGDLAGLPARYLADIARRLREGGTPRSVAEVIEGTRLARTLAALGGGSAPTLADLRDAAVTCLGHGDRGTVAEAMARLEVGTAIGALAEGVSQTSIQDDFNRELKRLKLESYKTPVARDLDLDLRENRRVQSEAAAWVDLHRSRFLFRLRFLGVPFARLRTVRQDAATWAEGWVLQWTPEGEIALVESTLRGETVELAAAFELLKQLDECRSLSAAAALVRSVGECALWNCLGATERTLQGLATDADSFTECAGAARELAGLIRYGSVRQLDPAPLRPLLAQLFLRGTLLLPDAAGCDTAAAPGVRDGIAALNATALENDHEVDETRWTATLRELADRDDRNPTLSGYACAILLERGLLDDAALAREVSRRLSPGIAADLGAGWFEGLSQRNRPALLSRLSLWRELAGYVASLDDGEFRRALVFLRRSFGGFAPAEKRQIAENLGEVWGVHADQASELLGGELTETEAANLKELESFDFDDL